MSGQRASEEEIVAAEVEQADLLIRVYRESFGYWWAELWRRPVPGDPPGFDLISPPPPHPGFPDGFVRVELEIKGTRRGAWKEGHRMAERYRAGLHPTHDRVPVEIEVVA